MSIRTPAWILGAYAAYELLVNRIVAAELLLGIPVALVVAGCAAAVRRSDQEDAGAPRAPRVPLGLPLAMAADAGRLCRVLARALAGGRPAGRVIVGEGAAAGAADVWSGSAAACEVVLEASEAGTRRVHRLGRP